jgi:hypothetical protein
MATSEASSCSGRSTGIAAIVVQLGLWVHPVRRRVVDDHRAGLRNARGEFPGTALARREQDDVESAVVGGRGVLDGDLTVLPRQGPPGGTGRSEEPKLVNGELALGQDAADDATDLSRCAYDADPHAVKSTACPSLCVAGIPTREPAHPPGALTMGLYLIL